MIPAFEMREICSFYYRGRLQGALLHRTLQWMGSRCMAANLHAVCLVGEHCSGGDGIGGAQVATARPARGLQGDMSVRPGAVFTQFVPAIRRSLYCGMCRLCCAVQCCAVLVCAASPAVKLHIFPIAGGQPGVHPVPIPSARHGAGSSNLHDDALGCIRAAVRSR